MTTSIAPTARPEAPAAPPAVLDVSHTSCCIVGGGPAGAVLALLLARQGLAVTLLEAHHDFDREFRGDTVHPMVLQIMEEIGLVERLHQLRHAKVRRVQAQTPAGPIAIDLAGLKTRYPYVMLVPQADFLAFITEEARRYPQFRLVMGARVEELLEENGVVRGVRYRGADGWHDVRAPLTVGADGRFSKVRKLSGLELIKTSPPIDILWFRLPRQASDQEEAFGLTGPGHVLIGLNRFDHWQLGYVIPKDSFQQLRRAGLAPLRQSVGELAPWLAGRLDSLTDWKQVSLLSIESSRLRRWHRPGLLLLGDAAHVMSPVGGVGINYAIQDAVVAANLLAGPLARGNVQTRHLAAVQRRRELPTRVIQAFQAQVQERIFRPILESSNRFRIPPIVRLLLRIPAFRLLPPRLMMLGLWPVHVRR